MGGAFTAISDDASGVVYNPAGLAFQQYWGDLGGNLNYVGNRETDLNGDGIKDGIPYTYAYYAGSLKFGNFGYGIGLSSPYNALIPFESDNAGFKEKREIQMSIASFNLPVAYRLSEHWSLGLTFQLASLEQKYRFSSTDPASVPISVSATGSNVFTAIGTAYRPSEQFGLGLFYQPEKNFYVDSGLNAQTGGVNWFRSVVVPAKTSFGTFFRPHPRLMFAFDLDHYAGVENTVYVGSELVPGGFKRAEILNQSQYVFHGGLEWLWIDTQWVHFYWRLGAYNEPARLSDGFSRSHTTGGFELRFWTLAISVAIDSAPDFINAAAGVGLSLKFYL
ncbi:MAG: hypothetical protein K2X47_10825 [Bdellovibrionales bacterium]|nr:hypothetical protein [Bdellovibrionales bacterium]